MLRLALCALLCSSACAAARNEVFGRSRGGPGEIDWESFKTTESLTKIATGAQTLAGVFSFIAPKESLSYFGVSTPDTSSLAFLRSASAVQLAGTAVLTSGYLRERDYELASTVALASSAIALILSLPGLEELNIDKQMVGRWVTLLCALARLSREPEFPGFNPAIVIFTLVGGQFSVKPKFTTEMYKLRGASRNTAALELLKLNGGNLLAIAGYLWTLRERSHGLGLSVYLGCNALATAQYAYNVEKNRRDDGEALFVRKDRYGWRSVIRRWAPAVWALAQGGLAALAYVSADERPRGGVFSESGRPRRRQIKSEAF